LENGAIKEDEFKSKYLELESIDQVINKRLADLENE
jgi:hypothetical protein